MTLAAKVEYACIAVLELAARHDAAEPVRIRDIADTHGIPSRFLVQILLQLKGAGLVASTRGATGGYALARRPEQITLADVIAVIEGPGTIATNLPQTTLAARVLLEAFREVAAAQQQMLASTSFASLAERLAAPNEEMYHI
jgi:Rrf2 family protein